MMCITFSAVQRVFGKGRILLIMTTILCAACSSQASKSLPEDESLEYEKHNSRWGELVSVSGDVDQIQTPKYEFNPSVIIPQLSKLIGLAERTDSVFQTVGANSYLYDKPGSKIEFHVPKYSDRHAQIRYRLAEINEQWTIVKTVLEHTTPEADFAIILPDREDVVYLLSLEALNEKNETIDTAIYVIEVVSQVIHAELTLDPTIFESNKTIDATIRLVNYGPDLLFYGDDYFVEQYENGSWHTLSFKKSLNFTSQLNRSQPGEVFSQRFGLPSTLSKGKYRVVKRMESGDPSTRLEQFEGVYLVVEFEVVDTYQHKD